MGWIETLSKETFLAAVREAVKPDVEKVEGEIGDLRGETKDLGQRVSRLEGTP